MSLAKRPVTDLLEDVTFLIDAREWPDRIATRVGYKNVGSLVTTLQRRGQHDLADKVRLLDRTSTYYMASLTDAEDRDLARRWHGTRNRKRAA